MTHNRTPTRTPTVASRPRHPRHPRLNGMLAALAVASAVVSARAAAPTAEQASGPTAAVLSAAVPLEEEIFGWIEEITAQGIRRAGHPANLWVEDYIVDQFKRFGLEDITKKPVPVTAWFEGETGLEVRAGGRSYDFNAYPAAFVRGSLRADAPLVKYTDGMTPEAIKGRIVVLDYLLADESAISLMAASLFAVNKGYLDDVDVKKVLAFEHGLHQHLKSSHAALLAKLENDKAMDKDAEAELTSAIQAFKKTFA